MTAPTHALLRTHRGRPDAGTRQHIAVADTGLTIHVVQGSEWHTGQAQDAVTAMQNAGILFRERV